LTFSPRHLPGGTRSRVKIAALSLIGMAITGINEKQLTTSERRNCYFLRILEKDSRGDENEMFKNSIDKYCLPIYVPEKVYAALLNGTLKRSVQKISE
jgi:hypothetical protein